ncbi:hypothetical protein AC249_AIPGENE25590 [Exaiptasia diaphana]|nr:hypothetical protein AC249_AIPGENE25590 [Exaiptasia diaphana]
MKVRLLILSLVVLLFTSHCGAYSGGMRLSGKRRYSKDQMTADVRHQPMPEEFMAHKASRGRATPRKYWDDLEI